jgi:hypothetical protein
MPPDPFGTLREPRHDLLPLMLVEHGDIYSAAPAIEFLIIEKRFTMSRRCGKMGLDIEHILATIASMSVVRGGHNARPLLDDPGGHDHRRGRSGDGATLRSAFSGLPPGLETGRRHLVRLQLYILGSMRERGSAEPGHVLAQPILAAIASALAGPASAPRQRLMLKRTRTAGRVSRRRHPPFFG